MSRPLVKNRKISVLIKPDLGQNSFTDLLKQDNASSQASSELKLQGVINMLQLENDIDHNGFNVFHRAAFDF